MILKGFNLKNQWLDPKSVAFSTMHSSLRNIAAILLSKGGGEDDHKLPEPPLGSATYAASAIVNLLSLALPLTVLQVYDRVLPNAAFETLTVLILVLAGAILTDAVLKYLRSKVVNWSAASFTHTQTLRALGAMLSSRPSSFSKTTSSEHLERMNSISGLGNHVSSQSRTVIVDILFIPVFSIVILLVGGWIFAGVVILFGVFGYLALRGTQSLNELIDEREVLDARKQDFIIEVLQSIHTVKANAMEPLMMRRFERMQSSASVLTQKMIKLTGITQTYQAAYASLSTVTIVSIGGYLALNGRLTLGALACCMLLSSQLLQPLMKSLTSWNEVKLAQHRRSRVNDIFSECTDPLPPKPHFPRRFKPNKVILKDVTIQYDGAPPLFEKLNLEIEAGSFVAIKGEDGSGRSTLLRALLHDAPITEGEIIFSDNVTGADSTTLARRAVRYVGQSPVIFRGTILDNISLFGNVPAKVALSASKFMGLDDEIVRMPLGYDTMLKSSSASDIPTTTAQRITLTRALAMRPSVLILDEANTLLDLAGEQQFMAAVERLRGKVTVIIASHRPSLIRLADRVFEIRDKSLAEITPSERHEKAAS